MVQRSIPNTLKTTLDDYIRFSIPTFTFYGITTWRFDQKSQGRQRSRIFWQKEAAYDGRSVYTND